MDVYKGEIFISFTTAGKYADEKDKQHLYKVNEVKTCCGFNWWYWVPRIRVLPKDSITVFGIRFFCFIFEIDDYKRGHRWI